MGTFEGHFTRIARTFSRDWGVVVEVGGREASANFATRRIVLPAAADYAEGEARIALEGLLDHETAHIRSEVEADPDFAPSIATREAARLGPLVKFLFNVYEDIRIELDAGARWAGVRENLERGNRYLLARAAAQATAGTDVPTIRLIGAVLIARVEGLDDAIAWIPEAVRALVDRELSEEIAAARRMRTAFDALSLARRTLAKIAEASRPPEPPPEPAEDESGDPPPSGSPLEGEEDADPSEDTSDDGEGLQGAEGDAEGPDPAETDGPGSDPAEEGEGSDLAQDVRDRAGAVLDEGEVVEGEEALGPARRALLREVEAAALSTSDRYLVHPSAAAADSQVVVEIGTDGQVRRRFEEFLADVSPIVGGMSTRLAALLRAPTDVRVHDRESGRIDSRALAGVRTGETRAFYQIRKAPGLDVAVEILLDQSGSMTFGENDAPAEDGQTRADWANRAALSLGEALSRAGVAFEVVGWDNDHDIGARVFERSTAAERALYVRFEPERLRIYKSFRETWARVCGRLGAAIAEGNNDDAGAILTASRRLLAYPARRRILLVLSDGVPYHLGILAVDGLRVDPAREALLRATVRRAIRAATEAGIEVGGLGILSEHVREFYPRFAVVRDLASMAAETVRLAQGMIARRAA